MSDAIGTGASKGRLLRRRAAGRAVSGSGFWGGFAVQLHRLGAVLYRLQHRGDSLDALRQGWSLDGVSPTNQIAIAIDMASDLTVTHAGLDILTATQVQADAIMAQVPEVHVTQVRVMPLRALPSESTSVAGSITDIKRNRRLALVVDADSCLLDTGDVPYRVTQPVLRSPLRRWAATALSLAETLTETADYQFDPEHIDVDLTDNGREKLIRLTSGLDGEWRDKRVAEESVEMAVLVTRHLIRDTDFTIADGSATVLNPKIYDRYGHARRHLKGLIVRHHGGRDVRDDKLVGQGWIFDLLQPYADIRVLGQSISPDARLLWGACGVRVLRQAPRPRWPVGMIRVAGDALALKALPSTAIGSGDAWVWVASSVAMRQKLIRQLGLPDGDTPDVVSLPDFLDGAAAGDTLGAGATVGLFIDGLERRHLDRLAASCCNRDSVSICLIATRDGLCDGLLPNSPDWAKVGLARLTRIGSLGNVLCRLLLWQTSGLRRLARQSAGQRIQLQQQSTAIFGGSATESFL